MFDTMHDATEAFSLAAEPAARPISDLVDAMATAIERLQAAHQSGGLDQLAAAYAAQELGAIVQMRDQLLGDLAQVAMAKWHADHRPARPALAVKRSGVRQTVVHAPRDVQD